MDNRKKTKTSYMIPWIKAFVFFLLGFVVSYFIFADSGEKDVVWVTPSEERSASNVENIQKTGVQIEKSIRAIIWIPERIGVVSILYIDSEEALETLTTGKNSLLDDALVGDYYVVFEDRAILYRDSVNQIINYAPIIRQ